MPRKLVEKQGLVIELDSYPDALPVLMRSWVRGLGILQLFGHLMIHGILGRCFFVAHLFQLRSEWQQEEYWVVYQRNGVIVEQGICRKNYKET